MSKTTKTTKKSNPQQIFEQNILSLLETNQSSKRKSTEAQASVATKKKKVEMIFVKKYLFLFLYFGKFQKVVYI